MEQLVTRYENRLYRTALAILGNREDAEDVIQEVFIKVFQKAPLFASEEHEKAWLIRVTVNQCRSILRSPWRQIRTALLDSYPAASPEQRNVMEAVLELPWKYRIVIHLFYYEGYSVREISGLTGQKESTVRSQLTRAREMLRRIWKEELK